MIVWIFPGAAEFGTADEFFAGDAEMFAGAIAHVPICGVGAEVVGLWFGGTPHPNPLPSEGRGRRGGTAGGFFAAEGECLFADYGGALEEIKAAVVLGEAFAGDLDAFDIDFDLLFALDVAGEEREVVASGVGRGGALK